MGIVNTSLREMVTLGEEEERDGLIISETFSVI